MSETFESKTNFKLFHAKMLSFTSIFPKVSPDALPPPILYKYKIANLPEFLISSLTILKCPIFPIFLRQMPNPNAHSLVVYGATLGNITSVYISHLIYITSCASVWQHMKLKTAPSKFEIHHLWFFCFV